MAGPTGLDEERLGSARGCAVIILQILAWPANHLHVIVSSWLRIDSPLSQCVWARGAMDMVGVKSCSDQVNLSKRAGRQA